MGKAIDLTGQRFGRWTVLEHAPNRNKQNNRHTYWSCLCDCGSIANVRALDLQRGHSRSCGCLSKEIAGNRFLSHGRYNTRLYSVWSNMITRCYNPNSQKYPHYGGRGISVCEEWRTFSVFCEWALNNGYTDDLTIDRIDVNGNYEPANCRWVSWIVQERNRTNNHVVTLNGQTKCLTEWCNIYGISRGTVGTRIHRGWSVEDALTTPVGQKRPKG